MRGSGMLRLVRAAMILIFVSAALAEDGAALFRANCATCHRPDSNTHAPLREALSRMPRQTIIAALETGSMKTQGAALTADERRVVAEFLSNVTTTGGPRVGF